jgi:glutaminase A
MHVSGTNTLLQTKIYRITSFWSTTELSEASSPKRLYHKKCNWGGREHSQGMGGGQSNTLKPIFPSPENPSPELSEALLEISELRQQLLEVQNKESSERPTPNQPAHQVGHLNKKTALYLKLLSYDESRALPANLKAQSFPAPSKHDRILYRELCGESSMAPTTVVCQRLLDAGLLKHDKRIAQVYLNLERQANLDLWELTIFLTQNVLVNKALNGGLAISDFPKFCASIDDAFSRTKKITRGKVASYIPSLASADPDKYAVAVCSVSGQQYSIGDTDSRFCVQSCSKPITYCIACSLNGSETVHKHIGKEPSGRNFNERVLMTPHGIPHNPFINTGAIMAASLVKPSASEADRYDYVTSIWSAAAGGCQIGFQNSTYLGERATASRNFCLGYMMEEEGAFPEEHDLQQALESYFMYCSLEMLASDMAVVASTLANGGVCPLTNARVFSPQTVQHCLTLMLSCGMYDYSGEWAFTIGVPTKSGVSGVLCVVIPGVAGICTFSPRLDKCGNRYFCRVLLNTVVPSPPPPHTHTYTLSVFSLQLSEPRPPLTPPPLTPSPLIPPSLTPPLLTCTPFPPLTLAPAFAESLSARRYRRIILFTSWSSAHGS